MAYTTSYKLYEGNRCVLTVANGCFMVLWIGDTCTQPHLVPKFYFETSASLNSSLYYCVSDLNHDSTKDVSYKFAILYSK